MRQIISRAVKKLVIARAGNRCEYCRVPEYLSAFDYHIEHIIGIQHGGPSEHENLAYCCSSCNWKKGPNIGTVLEYGGPLMPLYNPRTQNWFDHFKAENGHIKPLTPIGEATVKLLELNQPSKVEERNLMELAGFFP